MTEQTIAQLEKEANERSNHNHRLKRTFKQGARWYNEAVWHDHNEEPEYRKILVRWNSSGHHDVGYYDKLAGIFKDEKAYEICPIDSFVDLRWAYLEDLLPPIE